MAGLTYTTLQQTLATALVQAPAPYIVLPPDFAQLYPQAIAYAEGRIYRDVVMLANRSVVTSISSTAGSRTLSLAGLTLPMLAVEGVALVTPSGSTLTNGTQQAFDESTLDVIDLTWPQQSETLAPNNAQWIGRRWAMQDNQTIVIAPTPDAAYVAAVVGLVQPAPLSATNTSTYLSTIYPEVLTAACMVFLSGALMRNYSSQGGPAPDEPGQAVSWEGQYNILITGVIQEERRRRGLSPDVALPTK